MPASESIYTNDASLDTAFMTAFYAKIVEITQDAELKNNNSQITPDVNLEADEVVGEVDEVINAITEQTEPSEEIAAILNGVDVGGAETATIASTAPTPLMPPQTTTLRDGQSVQPAQAAQIAEPVADRGTPRQNTGQNNTGGQSGQQQQNSQATQIQNGQVQPNINAASLEGFTLTDGSLLYTDGDSASFTSQAALPSSSVAQAANAITNAAQHAGHTHPATRMVSAKLQQGAQQGQNQTLTLYLEPADLGRVEVRMEFGPEKTLQTHILVEKPEALSLLQRDSFFLERSLQDAGLDVDGGGINFELAEDGSAFEQNNNSQNGDGQYGQDGNEQNELEEIIESTMTWNVNPETGYTHYNILV